MAKVDEINKTMGALKMPVTEDEIVSINIIIISWIWKECLGRKYSDLAQALGMNNDRTLQDLRSGFCNHETFNVINRRVAEEMAQRISVPTDVFLGKEGILFKDESKRVSLKQLVLYRRLLRLKKHELHREHWIRQGMLEGFLDDKTYPDVISELTNPENGLKKTDSFLNMIKRKTVTALKDHLKELDTTKARGNHYYPRLLYFFKYEYITSNDKIRIDTVIESMQYWNPDNLRELDSKRLELYLKALRRQESFVQTALYLKEDTK